MQRSTQATVDEAVFLDPALDPGGEPSMGADEVPPPTRSSRSTVLALAALVVVIAGWLLLTSGDDAAVDDAAVDEAAVDDAAVDENADGLFDQRRPEPDREVIETQDPAVRPGYWDWVELDAPDGTTAIIPIPEGYLAVGLGPDDGGGNTVDVWLSGDGIDWESRGRRAGGFESLSVTPRLTVAVDAEAQRVEFSIDDGATFDPLPLPSLDDLSIVPWLEPASDLERRGPAFSVRITNSGVVSVLGPITVDLTDHQLVVDPLRDRFEIRSVVDAELLADGSLSDLRDLVFRPDTEPLGDGLLGDPWGDGEWFMVLADRRLGSFTDDQWDRAVETAGYDLRAGRWGALSTSPFVATTTDGIQWLEAPLSLAVGSPVSFVDLQVGENRAVIEAADASVRLDALLIAGSGPGPSRWFVTRVRDSTYLQGSADSPGAANPVR